MAERSSDWLAQAERDLASARWAAQGGFHEWACFAAQQAAEKAVKAVYQRLGGEAWGHSVAGLLEGLRDKAPVPDDLLDAGRALDRFYIPTRYPNGWDSGPPMAYFTREDADDAVGRGAALVRFCTGLLAEPG